MKEQLFFSIIGIAIILVTILLIIPFLASLGEYAREPMSNGILEGLTSLLLCILFSVAAFILLCMQSKQRYNSYWPGLLSFVISMFLLLGFFSGKSYYYQNSKKIHTAINRKKDWFEWKICMSHPRFNPVEISSGSFTYSMNTMKKYRSFYDVQGSFNESWGLQRYLSPGQNIRDEYTAFPMPDRKSVV